jgi:hypothetical protein
MIGLSTVVGAVLIVASQASTSFAAAQTTGATASQSLSAELFRPGQEIGYWQHGGRSTYKIPDVRGTWLKLGTPATKAVVWVNAEALSAVWGPE